MNNIHLGTITLSFVLSMSLMSLICYPNSIGILRPHQAFAQNSTDIAKLLVGDAIQALKNKDVSGALEHLKLIDQHLGVSGNSIPILTSKLLVEDAIRALQNGDTNTALSHVLVASQQLGVPITTGVGQVGHPLPISGHDLLKQPYSPLTPPNSHSNDTLIDYHHHRHHSTNNNSTNPSGSNSNPSGSNSNPSGSNSNPSGSNSN